ncbi:MAG: hypothetical protein FWD63_05145 [Propionibacteriaceae bacterium]|nr:hypothetical protein [Propionibacteriaceae bacterium]
MTRTERDLRRHAVILGLGWVATRTFMVYDWWVSSQFIMNDVSYYYTQMGNPGSSALVEYPTPILWLMRFIYFITQGSFDSFFNLVVALMVTLDALVAAVLFWRASTAAAVNWVVFLALLGPIMWFRIDLIPAAAVTLGLLLLATRPGAGGALLAVGAAAKIWPALLILPALGRTTGARRRGIGFGIAGASLALLSLLFNGWARSISPITWQDRRGLQIESLPATWAMIRHAGTDTVRVVYTDYHAYQVIGTGVSSAETVADWLMAAAIVYAIAIAVLLALVPALKDGPKATDRPGLGFAIVLAAAATIAAMIAANKTFSPQYLIWLAGPLGLLLAGAKTASQRWWALTAAVLGCIIAGLTQLIFPLHYNGLTDNPGDPAATAMLASRNLLMAILALGLMVWAARSAWRVANPLQ